MVFNVTFNNISVISWRSVLLMEETEVLGENHRQTLSHSVVSSTPPHKLHNMPLNLILDEIIKQLC